MKHLFLAVCLCLAACSAENAPVAGPSGHAMSMEKGIVISNARMRAPLPGRDIAAAYFHIQNNGEADQLVSITSPVSPRIELHTHLNDNGVMRMRRVEGVDLPAGEAVMFKPGGLHAMMFDVALEEGADEVALTLNYKSAPSVTVIATIGMDIDKPKMDHSAH